MTRIRRTVPLLAALAALALPAAASADWHAVIKDCALDGKLDRTYSDGDLTKARDNLPLDTREYTDCNALIEAALATNAGRGSNGGGGSPGPAGGSGVAGLATGVGPGRGAVVTASGAAGTPDGVAALKGATRSARKAKPNVAVATGGGAGGAPPLIPAASSLNKVPGSANGLPPSLVLAILAVAVLCSLGAAAAGRRLWPALLRAPLRISRR